MKWCPTLAITTLSALLMGGCELDPRLLQVDPIVDYQDESISFPPGPPTLTIGFYSEQFYEPLFALSPLYVIHGFQGGTWTMPAVRTRGISSPAMVSCSVTLESGEVLGTTESMEPFQLTTDGWLEIQAYPVPVHHAPPNEFEPIDDLYGLPATLDCSVEDSEGRVDALNFPITLTEG